MRFGVVEGGKATAPEGLPGGKASGAGAKGRGSLLDELVDDET